MRRPEGFDGPRRRPDPASGPSDAAASDEPASAGDATSSASGSRREPGLAERGSGRGATGERPAPESASPDVGDADADAPPIVARARATRRSESHASRTDRLLREAALRELRRDRAEARRAAGAVRSADRARRRAERAEVRRFTTATRRRVRIALGTVGALVGSFALLVGLVHSPLMTVREVEVVGAERVDPVAIQAALANQLGRPIATVTDAGVRTELERFAGLQSFAVDVVPPGTIVVRVVERVPIVVADGEDGPVLLDPAGVELGAPAGASLPALEDVEVGSDAFEAIAGALVAMPSELRAQVATVTASTSDDVTMTLATGQRVVWGGAAEAGLKADVLEALLASADPAQPATFDVSAPEHPVVR